MASAPFKELASLTAQGRTLVYVPNDGNHGDALIAAATVQAFEKAKIPFTVLGRNFRHERANVYVYGGGGNFVPMYRTCARLLEQLSPARADFLILPHSCFGVDQEILGYRGRLKIWAREKRTWAYLKKLSRPGYAVGLADDLAIGLDLEDPRLFYFHRARDLRASRSRPAPETLNAFRRDGERRNPDRALPEHNFDVSDMYEPRPPRRRGFWQGGLDADLLFLHASWFLAFIDGFDAVRTDRLHVGIAAMLLGKDVELHDNSYGKVSAVYQHSLRDKPNVRLVAG
jgi:exopolysaccharide biosynthesis predicted pyruvyltransferase EpsI